MATLDTWVQATRRHLMSGRQEERNVLSAPYTAGSGTLSFTNVPTGIVPGARLGIGLNVFYVLTVNNASLSATVIGGQDGSVDVAAPTGSLVRVNPRFTDFDITETLAADLADLSSPENGLFQIRSVDIAYSGVTTGYDLSGVTDLIDVYQVLAQEPGTSKGWTRLNRGGYRLDRGALASVFPSGLGLMLHGSAYQGLTVRVLYRSGFITPPTLATDLNTTGLPTTAYDIPPLGAAMRLVIPREIKRNFSEAQSDTRRAAEVGAGATAASYRPIAALRASRIAAEASRLVAAWPDSRL